MLKKSSEKWTDHVLLQNCKISPKNTVLKGKDKKVAIIVGKAVDYLFLEKPPPYNGIFVTSFNHHTHWVELSNELRNF